MLATRNFISILAILALHLLGAACDRAVLSHFIHGNTQKYQEDDWKQTFDLASKAEIDAFAFNIAQEGWTDTQLKAAFDVAPNYFTKICFSFDFAVAAWNTSSVIATLQRYVTHPGHYKYDPGEGGAKYLVSTFDGESAKHVDWAAVRSAVPDIYVVPHLSPDGVKANPPGIDGVLNWNAWATQNNLPIDGNSSTFDDHTMVTALGKGKAYASLVSPWSFTNYHTPNLVKQWIFKSDELLVTRWNQMLAFANSSEDAHIDLVELYSWNDYGESNYMNDISKTLDNEFSGGADLWCKGYKHDGWRLLNIPFTRAFKARQPNVTTEHIDQEIVVFHHRPYPAKTRCPDQVRGAEFVPDQVTITSMLKSPVELEIKSGGVTTQAQAAAGVFTNRVHMQPGLQSVSVMRNGKKCGEVTSVVEVRAEGECDTPNYNANVETIFVKC